ncbi:hypothetical protein AEYBE204_02830 [Asticcacaulis sp. YBE204]|nr:hypothetical protein AEYBE204_02830 [Asticcacaulis sp. YBE204]
MFKAILAIAALLLVSPVSAETVPVAKPKSILFIGNSFTFGANSAVRRYRADKVTDLNADNTGGVPALFKVMTEQAGLSYEVSLETVGGTDIAFHLTQKHGLIVKPWDVVVLQTYSTLDAKAPGNPQTLIDSTAAISKALRAQNPKVDIYLEATWARADLVYAKPSPWNGKPIGVMAADLRAGADRAASGQVKSVIPVGQAWDLAMTEGVADPNPYDGTTFGQMDLWSYDQYHASTYGYYLKALVVFGSVTGIDPRTLGPKEKSAADLGISPKQAEALQAVAYRTLHPN